MRKKNKFDKLPISPIDFFSIGSKGELRSFLNAAQLGMMQTDGLERYKELVTQYEIQIKREINQFERLYDFQTKRFLTSIHEVFEKSKQDIQQAIWYKNEPLMLFNKLYGIDIEFIEFVIDYIIEAIKTGEKDAFNATRIFNTYQQSKSTVLEEKVEKNMITCIGFVISSFAGLIEKDKIILKKIKNTMSYDDYNNLYRMLYPQYNKAGNDYYDKLYGRGNWTSHKNYGDEQSSHINPYVKRQKAPLLSDDIVDKIDNGQAEEDFVENKPPIPKSKKSNHNEEALDE
jgi:hypothetical protein